MEPVINQGKLTTWKDDRGFGFIKPDHGGKEVFLHISALKGVARHPKVGDTILYELVTQADGKVCAAKASIKGVATRTLPIKQKSRKLQRMETFLGLGIFTVIALFAMHFSPSRSPSPIASLPKPGCTIKGNISMNTGSKFYHLPGMEDYASTSIDIARGERWFCTESEAIANGWRKAPR